MDLITQFLKSKQHHETGSLRHVADSVWRKKSKILAIAKKNETPFYLIDDAELNKSIGEFESGFRKPLRQSRFFYAIKTNYHPHILRTAVKRGWGLDASSGRELDLALQAGARQILFTGPGKTDKELALAQKHAGRVILNIDNFSELARVGKLLRGKTTKLRAGVRFFSKLHETWSKFGIPLKDLGRFWHQAGKIRNLELSGVQFHSSLNRFPGRNAKIIAELGGYLKSKFPKTFLEEIKFIEDFVLTKLPAIINEQAYLDPKSKLQELVQERLSITPIYKVISESGPDHAKNFVIGVYISDRLIGEGTGPSKQDSEVEAAKNALQKQDF